MLRISTLIVAILTLATPFSSSQAVAETNAYISDEIGVTMRSGPNNRYRVIGNLRAGTPIRVLQADADNKTTEIATLDGKKTGWVKSQYISQNETVLAKYQKTQKDNTELQKQVSSIKSQLSDKAVIEAQNIELQNQVSELQNQVDQLSQQADLQKSRFHKDFFYAGGLTILVGMFIAWLLTRMAYSRRQRSGWR